jgi:hypothetical protein
MHRVETRESTQDNSDREKGRSGRGLIRKALVPVMIPTNHKQTFVLWENEKARRTFLLCDIRMRC